jgi:hypothetical protein
MGQKLDHLRGLAAQESGMNCIYCRVPTAATIEHLNPRVRGGRSEINNLALACPLCNTRKGTKDVQQFIDSGRWKLEYPDDLPETVLGVTSKYFGWAGETGHLRTGSPHARLKLYQQQCLLEIRPGKRYPWTIVNLGPADHRLVAKASYDFLQRHFTPDQPKEYKPNYRRKLNGP